MIWHGMSVSSRPRQLKRESAASRIGTWIITMAARKYCPAKTIIYSNRIMSTFNLNPSVSVVLPCRNEQGYIHDCLESILKQELPEGGLEILVADGMSTDGTREYLQRMAQSHPQIRVLENPGRIVSTGL